MGYYNGRIIKEEICGECKYHWCKDKEWICSNWMSDNFEEPTDYDDTCEEFQERK